MNILQQYGYTGDNNGKDIARITEVHKDLYKAICEHGEITARVKASVYLQGCPREFFPTAGDYVEIIYNDSGDSLITNTLERKSFFTRTDVVTGYGAQTVAANFDYVFIMCSLNNNYNIRRIERYITAAWQSGGIPVVILTKADVAEDKENRLREVQKIASGIGVFAISSVTGEGIDELKQYLTKGKTIVFLGSSGVGKSTLVNALAGHEVMSTGEIREDDSRGRHTTTHRQLILLDSGVLIIDTPGMRVLGMYDISDGIGKSFNDVSDFLGKCRFSDCTHGNEPGCAIRAAIESGDLPRERWESYLKLKREAHFDEDKGNYLRQKNAKNKAINMFGKALRRDRSRDRK